MFNVRSTYTIRNSNVILQFIDLHCRYSIGTRKVQRVLQHIFELEKPVSTTTKTMVHYSPSTPKVPQLTTKTDGNVLSPVPAARRSAPTSNVSKVFSCDKCASTFTRYNNLTAHMRIQHSQRFVYYECPECALEYTSKYNLKIHCAQAHAVELPEVNKHAKYVANNLKCK